MILFIFVTSVSAADSNASDVISTDESTDIINEKLALDSSSDNDVSNGKNVLKNEEKDELDDKDEIIGAGGDSEILGDDVGNYSELSDEISQSGPVKLKHKNYVYDNSSEINITEEGKVIDGNGAIIDMAGSSIRAFYVYVSDITIKNLTIKNANGGTGGAIYFTHSGTVIDCNFVNNKARSESYGGALYFGFYSIVSNCNFTNNTAPAGSGAIYFKISGTIIDCNFVNNKAESENGGGALYSYYGGNVSNCNFTNNTAPAQGGAICFLWDDGDVSNCNFVNNKISGSYGGAVYVHFGIITNCNFVNNKAEGIYGGGAVYVSSSCSLVNCSLTDNSAYRGGAFYSVSWTNAVNCNFTNNTAND